MVRATDREILSAVAHELKTPIAAVRGAAQALRRGGNGVEPGTRDRLLGVIVEAADQLGRLAEDLLAAARLDAGGLPVQARACDAAQVAAAVVEAAAAADASARLRLEAQARVPAVAADPGRLRQVLANLVDNALRHGGGLVEVRVEACGPCVEIAVRDEGPGIPPDQQALVFEPFHRLAGEQVAGAGLGLYLARRFVEAMGGELRVSSHPGHGTTFTVALPTA